MSDPRSFRCEVCDVRTTKPIWVSLDDGSMGDPEGWQGAFCSAEHGAQWVLHPTEPKPLEPMVETWADHAFTIGCLSLLLISLVAWGVGLFVGGSWLIRLIT